MTVTVIWHGTSEEAEELQYALARNCACTYGLMGVRTSTCPPHAMLAGDQRALDGLLWERRLAQCRMREEFTA